MMMVAIINGALKQDPDNPYYRGGKDHDELNRTEGYEVQYFIEHSIDKISCVSAGSSWFGFCVLARDPAVEKNNNFLIGGYPASGSRHFTGSAVKTPLGQEELPQTLL
jgi:hypothetical protein